jgi:prepilin-type N-terminal cleavage/methylation domain-containing protein/prepilin-type processing-associated H-X9-DG protein
MFSYPARPARPRAAAFTLVELLAVIAIIGVLAAIIIVGLGKVRANSRQSGCLSNLRQIGIGWQLYLADNKGIYAPFTNHEMYYWGGDDGKWSLANNKYPTRENRPLYPYISDMNTFKCPSDVDNGSGTFFSLSGNCYAMANSPQRGILRMPAAPNRIQNAGVFNRLQFPAKTILVFEHSARASEAGYKSNPTASWYRDNWHANDTSNILMADGHVETFQRAALDGYSSPTNPPGYTWGWIYFSNASQGSDWP